MTFLVLDAYLPASQELLETLTESTEVVGRVIDFSDSGTQPGVFAVVEVGARQRVIVRVDKVASLGE